MSRFLFAVPPFAGHINPTIAVAAALSGHEVAWVGHASALSALLPRDARRYEVPDGGSSQHVAQLVGRASQVRGIAAFQVLWEDVLLPLARSMLDPVEAAIRDFAPDLVVADQQALAGGLAARRLGVPWATSCTTSAALVDPIAGFPKVYQWRLDHLHALQREVGLEPWDHPDLSPGLVLLFSSPELVGMALPPQARLVGPAFGARPTVDFPWHLLADPPRVLVSLGTLNAQRGGRFFEAVVEGLARQPVQVLLVAPEEVVPELPPNVLRFDRVPQVALLPHLQAVVCHAGHNTVCEALAHGVPLVVAPITDDQPVVAAQVVAAGAGVRVRFGRVRGPELADAVFSVLRDPSYRSNAQRLAQSFERAGGAGAAAQHLVDAAERGLGALA